MTHKVQINDEIREANDEEVARIEALRDDAKAQNVAADLKAAALASARAKLAKLGLTDDELEAFLGV
jgi:hypothetical protein